MTNSELYAVGSLLIIAALWFYLTAVRSDEGKPSERLRHLLKIEGKNEVEIARLEAALDAKNPDWRADIAAENRAAWDKLKAEGRLYEKP